MLHYLGAKLLEGLNSRGERWNGDTAAAPISRGHQWRRELGLGFWRAEKGGDVDRGQGGTGGTFYRPGPKPLACGPRRPRRRGAGSGSDSTETRPVRGRKETPIGRPHLSAVEERKGAPGWIGLGNGNRAGGIFLGRGEKRERGKGEMGRLG